MSALVASGNITASPTNVDINISGQGKTGHPDSDLFEVVLEGNFDTGYVWMRVATDDPPTDWATIQVNAGGGVQGSMSVDGAVLFRVKAKWLRLGYGGGLGGPDLDYAVFN